MLPNRLTAFFPSKTALVFAISRLIPLFTIITALVLFVPNPAFAQADSEVVYILNTLSFLFHGVLVMLMAAGFCMLEAGLVRSKNTVVQCTKNIGLYAITGLMFWLVGYNLLYEDVGAFMGSFAIWSPTPSPETAQGFADAGYAASSDWFFQMVFVAAAASIVSGAVAERMRLLSFFVFAAVLTGIIYPIQASWSWGGGWLSSLGFLDFAGSSIVHSVGGWAALTGAVIVGARQGKYGSRKYGSEGRVYALPGANLPLATLGTFILWFGWFGFNGGSQLAAGSGADITAIANIFVNTNLAAAAGVIAALAVTLIRYGKMELTLILNGALGGLVAITAEPLLPSPALVVLIGSIGGIIVVISVPVLDRLRVDDVVGAIPVHLLCGIWGTLAVVLSNPDATLLAQSIGIAAIGGFVVVTSTLAWFVIKLGLGLRVGEEDEMKGVDLAECGLSAYPEFSDR